jgi:diacylglycerol kinase (ATP)
LTGRGSPKLGGDPLFIVNPRSANGTTRRRFLRELPELRRQFPNLQFAFTAEPMHASQLAKDAARSGARVVVACGGDGTLNEVVCGLLQAAKAGAGSSTALAVMPSGMGGDFRRTLGIATSKLAIETVLKQSVPRRLDVCTLDFVDHGGRCVKRPFINIASVGISGLVDRLVHTGARALGGRLSYYAGALRSMIRYRNALVSVAVDGQPFWEGKSKLVAMANGKFFGSGMKIAPDAEPDDGLIDVTVLGDLGMAEFVGLTRVIYQGRHLARPKIYATRGRVVEVTAERPLLVDLDGEQPGTTPVRAEIHPSALTALCPRARS